MTTDSTEQLRTTLAALDISSEIAEIARDPCRYGGIADIYQGVRMSRFGITSQVAIKFIRSDKKEFEKMLRRYRREIRVWQRIDHPNVLPLLGLYWGARPLPALVSPWCEHGSIRTYFQTLPAGVDVVQKKHISLQEIARGLAYLHSYTPPVIHGDLKGDNILVSDRGVARICDFGLSRITAVTTETLTTVRGTLRWMAPELLEDNARTTTATDVWAYACVMIEIFSGNCPYSEKASDQAIVLALVRGELPARPDGVSNVGWSLALRCLAPVPDKRISADHIVTDPLFNGLPADEATLSAEDTESSASASVDLDRQMLLLEEHPVNFIPCEELTIGNWRRIASPTTRNDLLAYSCDTKRCIAWLVQSTSFSFKMEIPYDVITRVEFKRVVTRPEVGQVTFYLCGLPTFFLAGIIHSSGVLRSWKNCRDWTEGEQATTVFRHDIYGPLTHIHASLSKIPLGTGTVGVPTQPLYESEMPLQLPSPPLMTLPTSSSIPMGLSPTHSIPTSSASNVSHRKQSFIGPPPHSQDTDDEQPPYTEQPGQPGPAAPSPRSSPDRDSKPIAKQILGSAVTILAMAEKIRVKGEAMHMLVEKAGIYATQIEIAVEGRIIDASLQRRLARVYSVFLKIEALVHAANTESRVLTLPTQAKVRQQAQPCGDARGRTRPGVSIIPPPHGNIAIAEPVNRRHGARG